MNKENQCGLWPKESSKGTKYHSGKVTIEGKEYYANIFKNDKKGNEKAPDLNLLLKPINIENNLQKETTEIVTNPFAEFASEYPIDENSLPF